MNATAAEIQQVVALRKQGLTHKQIAAEMGISWRRASYLHQAVMREQRREQKAAADAGNLVPPREPRPFRPVQLPATFQALAARAAAHQPRLIACASRVQEGGAP